MTQPLSRLERVELINVWPTEDGDFTPWLAEEENLELLGDTIGMELELEATEKNVGPFRADILCKNTDDESWVLIENQIKRTDHIHLGQVLTYAAGLDAVTMVWIASRFTDEHRAALDWLNRITGDEFRFFGLEVEAWRIGDSIPAPKFNIISQPNNWSKSISREARKISERPMTETEAMQLGYWTKFAQYLKDEGSDLRPQNPRAKPWQRLTIGVTQVVIVAVINTSNRIRVELNIHHSDYTEEFFNFLHDEKEAIETEIGVSLEWLELQGKTRSRILVNKKADPKNEKDWDKQHAWLKEMMEAFYRVFRVRVKAIAEEIKTE